MIDETVALFGDNEVAKQGLLSEIVMWRTEAAIKHKATDPDFCTCLEVINHESVCCCFIEFHIKFHK